MIASLTFSIRDLRCSVDSDGLSWVGRSKAEFIDSGGYPLKEDVTFLNRYETEVTISALEDGKLNRTFMHNGLDEQVEAWRAQGYPCADDAFLMRYWPKDGKYSEFLSVSLAIRRPRYDHAAAFFTSQFGKPDVLGRISCSFHGFRGVGVESEYLPSKAEFMEGRPYFLTGEQSITFSAIPLPG